jgi:hypothetical protein
LKREAEVSQVMQGEKDLTALKMEGSKPRTTGSLYKLEKAGNQFFPPAFRRNTAPNTWIVAL